MRRAASVAKSGAKCRMSLRTKIIGLFLLIALVPYAVVALFIYTDIRTMLETQAEQKLDMLATIQEARTEAVIQNYVVQLEQFATRHQLRKEAALFAETRSMDAQGVIRRILDDARRGAPMLNDLFVLGTDGELIAATETATADRIKGVVERGAAVPVRLIKTDRVLAELSNELVFNERVVGRLVMHMETDDLFELFRDYTGLGDTGSWGLAMRSPDGGALFIVPGRFDTDPDAPLERHRPLTRETEGIPIMRALAGEEKVFSDILDYRGIRMIGATRYLEDLGWGIGVVQERAEVLAAAQGLASQLIVFSGLLILFISLVSVIFANVILEPIRHLLAATEKAAAGDYHFALASGTDELGRLAEGFNVMMGKIRNAHAGLEERVRERTQELQKFQLAVENAHDHIVIIDLDGRIVYANKAVETITGFPRVNLLGKKVGSPELWGSHVEPGFYENVLHAIRVGKKGFVAEVTNKRSDGSPYVAHLSIAPLIGEEGEVQYFVELQHDLTKEKAIERAQNEFVSLASHQLRTPATSIRWFSEMLLSGKSALPQKERAYVKEVHESALRMIGLINSLLSVSRIDLGAFAVKRGHVDAISVIASVVEELALKAKERGVQIELARGSLELETDPQLFRIVMQNLIANAIDYARPQGRVVVVATRTPSGVQISVSDDGCGIPIEFQPHIFTKFFRADNAKTIKPDGNGLGLYITKSIVVAMRGTISFVSKENEGSTFTVTFPPHVEEREGTTELHSS